MSRVGISLTAVASLAFDLAVGKYGEAYCMAKYATSTKNNIAKVIQSDIKSSKLDSIKATIDNLPWREQSAAWQRTADSIRLKAAADSAYHKGAQMVRDSVAAAQKVK